MGKILIIDDEVSLRQVLRIKLKRSQHHVAEASNGDEGLQILEQQEFDVVFTDLKMPGKLDGLGVLEAIRERYPSTQVIVMTAFATMETAVKALKMGAYDYIQKPFQNIDELEAIVSKCLEKRALLKENVQLRNELKTRYAFGNLLGKSSSMRGLFALLRKITHHNVSVLITGENGTGKELVARAIHYNGPREKQPFIPINCGAIPETLIESELFGHICGAFTGADRDKAGLFRMADKGTLFLDEIGDLPLHTQVKLLRVLEEREVRPLGSEKSIPIDVRIVSATNKNLQEEVEKGNFREDLFFRLKVMSLELPALRNRREDIPLLAQHFLKHFCNEMGRTIEGFSQESMDLLSQYHYRGNVRELKNIIERAVLLESDSTIQKESLDPEVRKIEHPLLVPCSLPAKLPEEGLETHLESIERHILLLALKEAKGVRKEAARLLQISFRSFRYRIAKLEIKEDEFE